MTRTWIALLEDEPQDADLAVRAADGQTLVLVGWRRPRQPHPRACSVDPRIISPGGPELSTSWVQLPDDQRPLFDAPEVLEIRRRLLLDWPAYGVSTLVTDSVHLAGSVLLWPGGPDVDDPFARLAPARVLRSTGFFVPLPAPTGPALERYSGAPWPFDRFPDA